MAKPFVSFVIPAVHDARVLPITLADVDAYVSRAPWTAEIVVVCGDSEDGTGRVASRLVPFIKNMKSLEAGHVRGWTNLVRHGMLLARGVVRVSLRAEHSVYVRNLDAMLPELRSGAAVVVGSRRLPESRSVSPVSIASRVHGMFSATLASRVLLPGLTDIASGFMAWNEDAAEAVWSDLNEPGDQWGIAALIRARALGYPIRETAVLWDAARFGRLYPSPLHIARRAATIRSKLRRGLSNGSDARSARRTI